MPSVSASHQRGEIGLLTLVAAKKFLQQLMGAPVRNKADMGTFTTLIVGGVALLAFILRAIARLPAFGGQWGLDDWVMTAAMLLIIPLTICAYLRRWNRSHLRHTVD
jgi:hypothetical protein